MRRRPTRTKLASFASAAAADILSSLTETNDVALAARERGLFSKSPCDVTVPARGQRAGAVTKGSDSCVRGGGRDTAFKREEGRAQRGGGRGGEKARQAVRGAGRHRPPFPRTHPSRHTRNGHRGEGRGAARRQGVTMRTTPDVDGQGDGLAERSSTIRGRGQMVWPNDGSQVVGNVTLNEFIAAKFLFFPGVNIKTVKTV